MKQNPTVTTPLKQSTRPRQPVLPMTEPETSVQKADRVFLTPRVINAQSYEEMSANLRHLIERSELITETLQTMFNKAQGTFDRMKKASRRYEERLSLGARLFETMCKRADEVESIMKIFADQGSALEKKVIIADEHFNALSERLKVLENTARTIDDRLNGVADEIRSAAEPTFHRFDELLDEAGKTTEKAEFARKQAEDIRRQCDTIRQLMGQEMMAGAGLVDQLAIESEQLQSVLDAGASLTEAITKQSAEKRTALDVAAKAHLQEIDHEAQRQTGKIKSMKSELVGLIIDLDQRGESLQTVMEQYEKLNSTMRDATKYLKLWEPYLPNNSTAEGGIPLALRESVAQLRAIMDEEFNHLRTRLNRLIEAVTLSPNEHSQERTAKHTDQQPMQDNINNDNNTLNTASTPIVTIREPQIERNSLSNR